MRGYVIYKVVDSKKYVICIDQMKATAEAYEAKGAEYKYTHWDTECCGAFPKTYPEASIGAPIKRTKKKKRAKRPAGYKRRENKGAVHPYLEEVEVAPAATEWVDSRDYKIVRMSAYRMESDMLYLDSRGDVKDGTDATTAEAAWEALRQAIKARYPKP
jgi:hypothetical protein